MSSSFCDSRGVVLADIGHVDLYPEDGAQELLEHNLVKVLYATNQHHGDSVHEIINTDVQIAGDIVAR